MPVQLPERQRVAWRSVARATSVAAAASVAIVAFLGFTAAPDRSAWQDDHAPIAAALDQPAGTNDLLIDIVRPALAAGARTRSRPAPAVSEPAAPCSRASKTPAAMRSSSGEARLGLVAERLGRGGR